MAVEHPFFYLMRGNQADELLLRYHVEGAYSEEANKEFSELVYAYGSACDGLPNFRSNADRFEPSLSWRTARLFPAYKGADKTRQCVILRGVKSAEWHYRLETREATNRKLLNPVSRVMEWRLTDEKSGRTVTVTTASIGTLPYIQTFVAGCGLLDNPSEWDCEAGFLWFGASVLAGFKPHPPGGYRSAPGDDVDVWPVSALGRALSLQPRRPND